MAGRSGPLAVAVLALALAISCGDRAALGVQGAQYDVQDVQQMHRRLMTDLKSAQEKAGIFVDDAHLFTRPLSSSGRRLQQTDVGAVFNNPNILASLMSMLSQGFTVGTFPGAALALPGASPFGYAPTDDSYCLFATQPYTGAPAPSSLKPGSPLPSLGNLPGAFACIEADSNPPPSPDSFTVSYGGNDYVCQGAPSPASSTSGRKLQQAPSPADIAISNALATIGIPIWNCVVATTPSGNTTLGQATEAILNDLGLLAEHLLVYLNADGSLTYEQNVKNNFVSLANPLYPTGPRLNVSIDFATVAKDAPLLQEIFGKPAPSTPGAPEAGQSEGSSASPPGADSGQSNGSGTNNGGSGGSSGNGGSAATGSQTVGTPGAQTPGPSVAPPAPTAAPQLVAYDGYVDNCQTVIGSTPHSDGNFDRTNNFSTVITDGKTNMTAQTAAEFAGQVAYVIPASKAVEYTPLTLSTRKSAPFCYDVATLQPVYNPLAAFITANASTFVASPLGTAAVFGQAFGLTPDALAQALCLSLPTGQSINTYDALGAAITGSGQGLSVLKTNVELSNIVTAGANLLTNDSTTYASYAIIIDQSIARQAIGTPSAGRKLLQAPTCGFDLTNATTIASIITAAQASAPTQPDEATRAALIPTVTPAEISSVAAAIANLNAAVSSAPDANAVEVGQYYGETQLGPQVSQLTTGEISGEQFASLTSSEAISRGLSAQQLPGTLAPTGVSPSTTITPVTESSTSSGSGGLSHGGTVALATVLPIVGVIAIVAAIAYYVSRKNSTAAVDSSNNSAVWWRRPFARSGGSASPIAGSSSSV